MTAFTKKEEIWESWKFDIFKILQLSQKQPANFFSSKPQPSFAEMLIALGSFAYKYYSMDPIDPQATSLENAISILLEKIQISMLRIEVLKGFWP